MRLQLEEAHRRMTKLEPHRCDRCGDLVYLPEETIHSIDLFEQEQELCCLCKEALEHWFTGHESQTPGVVNNEKKVYERGAESE